MKHSSVMAGALALVAWSVHAAEIVDRSGGPFVPTPAAVVDAMLKLGNVGPGDHVVDLGSGDGRIVLAAASRYRASGVGIEIDEELVEQSNAAAKQQGVAERARFLRQDVREADLSRATVLTLYLLPGMMTQLRNKVLAEMKPGARVVSHDFHFESWKPDRTVAVATDEKYEMPGHFTSEVHLWVVPAAVQGKWSGKVTGGREGDVQLDFRQAFQVFEGGVVRDGRTAGVRDGQVSGTKVSFSVAGANGRRERYVADVSGDRMAGEVRDGETVIARWSATRVP